MISEVYNEDCMVGMSRYPDKYFELAIVDPPYGIRIGTSVGGGASHSVHVGGKGLSHPKFIGGLMILKSPTKNTSLNYKGSVKIK